MGKDYCPSRRTFFLSRISNSCAVEQFHSDVSLEALVRRAPGNSKNWKWRTEGYLSSRQFQPVPHGGEWPYNFLQAVGSTLIYCYRCANIDFAYSSTFAVSWTAYKCAFIQDFKSWQTIWVCNGLMSTESSKLIGTKLFLQMNHAWW